MTMTDNETVTDEAPFLTHGPGWYTRVSKATGNQYLFLVATTNGKAGQVSVFAQSRWPSLGYTLPREGDTDLKPRTPYGLNFDDLGRGWWGHFRGLLKIREDDRRAARHKREERRKVTALRFAERRGRAS